ncbi:MAG: hypothetical protein JWP37_2617 [Mucilaginibacter sp.]|nr:hypothetical protein [Mucilaginibacter sp.]
MTILQQNTGQNYEIGYTYDVNADGTVNVNHFQGSNNSSSVDINIPIPVDGFTHSHYSGDFPTFSGADIQQIYQIMQAGKMKNPNTLTLFEGSSDFTTWEPIINNKVTNTNCNN